MTTLETVLKRFEEPDEVRTFEKGKFELVRIGGMAIGRRNVRTRVEVVRSCRPLSWGVAVQRRACWPGALRLCHRCDG
jgi:hypothetical protein